MFHCLPVRFKTHFTMMLSGLIIGIGVSPPVAFGQFNDPETTTEAHSELTQIEKTIEINASRIDELRDEIERMTGDRSRQSAALIEAARRVHLAELEVDAISERIAELNAETTSIEETLGLENSQIGTLLTALQVMERNPPPVLIVNPDNASRAARAAMLLAQIIPQLGNRADAVRIELEALLEIRQKVIDERAALRANLSVLMEEKLRISVLVEARNQGLKRANRALAEEQREAELLAMRSKSLTRLLEVLDQEVETVARANDAARRTDNIATSGAGARLQDEAIQLALADTGRSQPAFPFPMGKGHLLLPVNGVEIIGFGENDGFGGTSRGTFVVTRAEASVIAPADGWVLYKGPYLNYGQIVILNVGRGFHFLLAGLEEAGVELGQFVLMGEPVGSMGKRTISQTISTSAGNSRPTLYIELRQDGVPVDLASWWAPRKIASDNG